MAETRSGMPADDPTRIERLRAMFTILEESSLEGLDYEDAEIRVSLKRTATAVAPVVVRPPAAAPVAPPPVATQVAELTPAPIAPQPHVVTSPFVGTFYRAKSPSAKPFTDVGELVRHGETLCIVEAMKLMNEIEADADGLITKILVENGATVQYGDPLFEITNP